MEVGHSVEGEVVFAVDHLCRFGKVLFVEEEEGFLETVGGRSGF